MATIYMKGAWSQDERQHLLELVRQGLEPNEISIQLNRSVKGVNTIINQMSVEPGFNRAMLEGAARRCLTGKKTRANSKRHSKSAKR